MTAVIFRRRGGRAVRTAGGRDERGFSLIEVALSVVMLGIVGVAATYLVIRLTAPRALTIRYEQRSLAVRSAADEIWSMFRESTEGPPGACILDPAVEEPEPNDYLQLELRFGDDGFQYAFWCLPYVINGQPSDELYRVVVMLQRVNLETGERYPNPEMFDMLALVGGYGDE